VCKSFETDVPVTDAGKKQAVDEINRRHCFWVKRKSGSDGRTAWRPAKRHRTAAKNWLLNLDNQVSVAMLQLPFVLCTPITVLL
jgi:hypothetical protein